MVIKTYVYETIWNELKSIYAEFLVENKIQGGEKKSQNPILPAQTLEEQKLQHYTLATLCLLQGRTSQVFIRGDFLETPPSEINTLNFLSFIKFRVLPKNTIYFSYLLTLSYIASTNVSWSQDVGLPPSHPKLIVAHYTTVTVKTNVCSHRPSKFKAWC